MDSTYRGKAKFDREQLIFVVQSILGGTLDRIDSGLPNNCDWDERVRVAGDRAEALTSYDRGALESAGMALGIFYAQLTDDGLGIYDALQCADKFDDKCEELTKRCWADKGLSIRQRMERLRGRGSYHVIDDLYNDVFPGLYPNTRRCAEVFVDNVFKEYLSQ